MREVPLEAARRAIVARQGFARRNRRATAADVAGVVDRLGCVQIDAISTVDRSQRLTLGVRAGRVGSELVNRLMHDGRVWEYWAHEACLLPTDDHRYFRATMKDDRVRAWARRAFGDPKLLDHVRATIRERGPVSSRDFGGAGTGYWNWTPVKRILDALWTIGELAIAHRKGVERRYDLAERVLPERALAAPDPSEDERLRYLLTRTVRARAIVREARIADYYRLAGGRRKVQPTLDALVADGVLERVRLRESGDVAVVVAGEAQAIADGAERPRGAYLLSPFDNLLWDRIDTAAVFGFEHALEIYKRPHERVWGYYVLPLLDGSEIVGRVDTKADRQAGVLRALAVHWQGRPRPRALRESLERLAWRLGLPDTEVVRGGV